MREYQLNAVVENFDQITEYIIQELVPVVVLEEQVKRMIILPWEDYFTIKCRLLKVELKENT